MTFNNRNMAGYIWEQERKVYYKNIYCLIHYKGVYFKITLVLYAFMTNKSRLHLESKPNITKFYQMLF